MRDKRNQNINTRMYTSKPLTHFNQIHQNTSRIVGNKKSKPERIWNSCVFHLGTQSVTKNDSNKQPRRPWFIWILSIIQLCVFIGELINNWILTHRLVETNLSINPLFGPSPTVLINMGACYSPCMQAIDGITNNNNLQVFPCPNGTTGCTLSQLCGFNGVSNRPNQWYRFIIPIFLHAGIVHISVNLFTQLMIGGDIEKKIGVLRISFIYFTSGIFGYILGSTFGPELASRVGCSGALAAIIALALLDLLYNWKKIKHPIIQLILQIADIVITFVLGLLPGIDNFSHMGGFGMGLILGLAVLGSPANFREKKKTQRFNINRNKCSISQWYREFFHNRPKIWWIWWLVRFITLAGAIVLLVLVTENFYSGRIKCTWCKYISCLPVNGWCDLNRLNTTNT